MVYNYRNFSWLTHGEIRIFSCWILNTDVSAGVESLLRFSLCFVRELLLFSATNLRVPLYYQALHGYQTGGGGS